MICNEWLAVITSAVIGLAGVIVGSVITSLCRTASFRSGAGVWGEAPTKGERETRLRGSRAGEDLSPDYVPRRPHISIPKYPAGAKWVLVSQASYS
jgi:hypothetical protein